MSFSLLRTTAFIRAAQRMVRRNPSLAEDMELSLKYLREDPYHPRLKTHKLKGSFAGVMACSTGYDARILFKVVEHEGRKAILVLTVGTHDDVY